MPRRIAKPVLFFDFDNTLTDGDILDQVIERFSPNEDWRDWEYSWECGRLAARDCLRLQVENLQVTRKELFAFLSQVRVDPAFSAILDLASARGVGVNIVSDSFAPIIRHILSNNGIDSVPVFANDLGFSEDRLLPAFPHADPACARSANAKARHLAPYRHYHIIFAGDGRSDMDAALGADTVFAKSTLASELGALSVPFRPFDTVEPVLQFLQSEFRQTRPLRLRLA
jgi:2,3-diketo-5-methylthio-1-phosphopentane phosphatase